MSTTSIIKRKRYSDFLMEFIGQYRREHPGQPIRMQEVAKWVIARGLWEPKRRNPARELARDLARASRAQRTTDPQGRSVRAMHAARYERVDQNGNRIFDVVWDHIFQIQTSSSGSRG